MKKYKLGEICTIVPGYAFKATDFGKGLNYVIKIKDIMPPYIDILHSEKVETVIDKKYEIKYGDFVMAMTGATIGKIGKLQIDSESKVYINQRVCKFIPEAFCDKEYLYYKLNTQEFQQFIYNNVDSKLAQPNIGHPTIYKYELELPLLSEQRRIGQFLKAIDDKIALNRSINHNLEAMAKQLYDYWFVQFDFPDENGKPYKSSGGKMVWNEKLKREIPEGWNVCRLSEFVSKNNAGDWGTDDPFENSIEIGCIRGADIIKLNNLPKRYIKSSNRAKILSVWDVVIEVSGGSPIQATGRSAFITSGVIERNGGQITCSNFCHAFSFKDYRESAYFFYIWKMFYDNGIMFNYEGKTSGIKNFMTETFLANKWVKAPKDLIYKFFDTIKSVYSKIDANITESNDLIKLRDSLLPLLMNGQVSVNYDLSNDWFLSSRKFLLYMV